MLAMLTLLIKAKVTEDLIIIATIFIAKHLKFIQQENNTTGCFSNTCIQRLDVTIVSVSVSNASWSEGNVANQR